MESHETLVVAIGMLASLGLPLTLAAVILAYKHKRNRLNQEAILRLVEKGLPVPPELLAPPGRQAGLKGGLVLIALGIGLAAFFAQLGLPWSIGLIPGLMGVALLTAWKIARADPNRPAPH
jgi:hypothetical protein